MQQFGAIIVGAGASGGLASMIPAEAGLKVLLLDAGRTRTFLEAPLSRSLAWLSPRIADPRLAAILPIIVRQWGVLALKTLGYVRQPVQSKCFAWVLAPDAFVDDRDFPYTLADGTAFKWFRSHGLGGRMVAPGHGRQYHRLLPIVFDDWPITADELAPWHQSIEARLEGRHGGGAAASESEKETLTRLKEDYKNTSRRS